MIGAVFLAHVQRVSNAGVCVPRTAEYHTPLTCHPPDENSKLLVMRTSRVLCRL